MTVLCVFWNQSLIVSSISVLCTILCPRRLWNHLTRPNLQSKCGDLFGFAVTFHCLGSVPWLPLPPSAIVTMSSRYLKQALMCLSCITSSFRLHALCMTSKNSVTDFRTCHKPDARSLFNLEKSLTHDHCAFQKLVPEQKQDDDCCVSRIIGVISCVLAESEWPGDTNVQLYE